jgi:hypothetical protein
VRARRQQKMTWWLEPEDQDQEDKMIHHEIYPIDMRTGMTYFLQNKMGRTYVLRQLFNYVGCFIN